MTVPTLTKDCKRCGEPVERDAPTGPPHVVALFESMPFLCDACSDESDREEAERAAATAEHLRLARSVAWRDGSGIPAHLLDWRFSSIDRPTGLGPAIEAAMRWAAGDLAGLILSGDVGVGKTRIAIAAANAMLDKRRVKYFSAPFLIARLGTGDFSNPLRQEALDVLTGNAPLVLDDLDKARPTVYAAEALFVAVDQRADGAAPLLITTNLRLRELAQLWPAPFGEAIASRLTLLEGVRVEGSDRRGSAKPSRDL